jgi:hypothetical protein
MRSAEAPPVHKTQSHLPGRRLDVPAQDVVVPHRCSLAYGLEHQILGAVRLDDLVSAGVELWRSPEVGWGCPAPPKCLAGVRSKPSRATHGEEG